jgi:hypothetical protein
MSRIATQLGSTSKARTCTGLTVWVSLVVLTVLAALPIQRRNGSAPEGIDALGNNVGGDDLLGGNYTPQDPVVSADLADWKLLNFEHGDISSVRMVGKFWAFTDGNEKIDVTTTKPAVLRTFEQSLLKPLVLRPGISDVNHGSIKNGSGEHQGVFVVKTRSKGSFVIGIGRDGFYLGMFHGTERHRFCSAALARQVDELVFEASGKQMPADYLRNMSGQYQIDQSNEVFERNRPKESLN